MYLIDTDYVISMLSVISYKASNVRYMCNDHEHDRISFTCAYSLINTIYILWSWPLGQGHAHCVMGPDLEHNCAGEPQF